MTIALIAIAAWALLGSLLLCLYYRAALIGLWREPVLAHPVLVIESDDWGPGPRHHAKSLRRIAGVLSKHRDCSGAPAVMTLGMLLSVPDGGAIRKSGCKTYSRVFLDDQRFAEILEAAKAGETEGVFRLQLHGMEHCWPPAVLASAEKDPRVRHWLTAGALPDPTELPPELQSRWTNASTLPSTPLKKDEIAAAAAAEVAAFQRIFGRKPVVAVPPTFVWTETVESAWVGAGVRIVVTPGARLDHRDSSGKPVAAGSPKRNTERGASGALYAVRNGYFEPKFGHTADDALIALERNVGKSRPTLLETHRFNFTDSICAEEAFRQLTQLLGEASRKYPGLRFLSTENLIERLLAGDPSLVEDRARCKLNAWLRRLEEVPRFRKLAWLTGLGAIAWLLMRIIAPVSAATTGSLDARVAAR